MGKILMENLEFYANHGLFEEEQKIGAKYLIDLELTLDFSAAVTSDSIDGTVDYGAVYELVAEEMKKSSKLIEHIAGRIVSMLFVTFKKVEHVKIKLTKVKPPIHGNVQQVSVVLEKER